MPSLPIHLQSAKRMSGRDPNEKHRVASSLELLFDLVFVVAVSAVARELHHALVEHHITSGLLNFAFSFFSIFWAWLNYTWFASAYDTDDRWFRILTMGQMFGAVVMAVGVANFATSMTSSVISVIGYAIMRLALATQWLRAAWQDSERRKTCLTYAVGITIVQMFWIARLWFPTSLQVPTLLLFWVFEMAVPLLAERKITTPWHAHHIAERYGLFVIIVLGEGVLGTTNAVAAAMTSPEDWGAIGVFGLGAMGLIFAIWWLYFEPNWGDSLHHFRNKISFVFGYGHFFIFASLAALGVAFEVATDQVVQYLANKRPTVVAHEVASNHSDKSSEVIKDALETVSQHVLTNGYVAMCVAGAVTAFLTAYTVTRWLMLDKYQANGTRLWLAYVLAVGWLAMTVALYQFTRLDVMWLGWLMLVAPMVMTWVCPKGYHFEH